MILIDNVLCSIHRDIINQGFTNLVTLPDSDDFDCVTCTCIADVDWDGRNEIILGTYGQVHFQCIVISCVEAFTQGEGNLSIFCLLRLRRGGGGVGINKTNNLFTMRFSGFSFRNFLCTSAFPRMALWNLLMLLIFN